MALDFDNSKSNGDQTREKYAVPIKCRCGQVGSSIWEENAEISPRGSKPILLEVSSGFYVRLQKKDIRRTEIVCSVCECVVRD